MKVFSNEIVFRGHPDKVCDQISDALLDEYLALDKGSRCAIEVMGGKGKIFLTGEVTSSRMVDAEYTVRRVLRDIGYPTVANRYEIIRNVGTQSPDIAMGTNDTVGGAGDQGMMFGYAEKSEDGLHMPVAVSILRKLAIEYDKLVHTDERFLPDGKAQITGLYHDGKLVGIPTFVVSYQNTEVDRTATDYIIYDMVENICTAHGVKKVNDILINPTGRFEIGGFAGDAGLTGRKIIVDTYQGFARHGGGAFSGKDPTKVDRSAAYMARFLAKSLVDCGACERAEVQLSYCIGVAEPVGLTVNSYSFNGKSSEDYDNYLAHRIREAFDLTPTGIIKFLKLGSTKYEPLAAFGHIGRDDIYLPWEDMSKSLQLFT